MAKNGKNRLKGTMEKTRDFAKAEWKNLTKMAVGATMMGASAYFMNQDNGCTCDCIDAGTEVAESFEAAAN